MKKIIALVLVLAMSVMLFAGCASESTTPATPATNNSPASNEKQEEAPVYRIGVILYGKDDTLGGRIYSLINSAAAALNCEVTWALGDYDPTAQLASAENLIAAGVDGLLFMPLAEASSQRIGALCEENGVHFGVLLRGFSDENINKELRANPYLVGNILGDDIGNAKELSRIMMEEYGKKELCIVYAAEGSSMALRNIGIKDAMAECGGKQLAETTISDNVAALIPDIQNFVNTNPSMNGIISASGGNGVGESIGNLLVSMKTENIKYACFDTFEGMQTAFENGTLGAVCGGQAPAAVYLFSLLYNAIDGHALTETGEELLMTYMFLRSAEEAENYLKYIDNPEVELYTADEIRNMTVRYNEAFNYDALKEVMAGYTYQNIISKVDK